MKKFETHLQKYAEVITQIGANVQKGQRVWVNCTTDALPLVYKVVTEAYKLGASDVHVKLADDKLSRLHAELQPKEYFSEIPDFLVDERRFYLDNNVVFIHIISSAPDLFNGIEPQKLADLAKNSGEAFKYYRYRTMNDKNSWTIAAYPSPSWAKLVFPNEENNEVAQEKLLESMLKATRIYEDNPVEAWEQHREKLTKVAQYLNDKHYKALHYTAPGTDLTIELAKTHIWVAAGGINEQGDAFIPNMPTEEVFTAAHKYGLNGYVTNTKPLSYQGTIIDNFTLTFKDGKVVDFKAEQGYETLKHLLEQDEGSKYIGEVALVPHDSPISNSGLLYYNTLFDENASNHLALGAAYPTNIVGGGDMTEAEVAEAGINQSTTHVDFMIGSSEMNIDGITEDGTKEAVFRNGNWAF